MHHITLKKLAVTIDLCLIIALIMHSLYFNVFYFNPDLINRSLSSLLSPFFLMHYLVRVGGVVGLIIAGAKIKYDTIGAAMIAAAGYLLLATSVTRGAYHGAPVGGISFDLDVKISDLIGFVVILAALLFVGHQLERNAPAERNNFQQ